MGWFGGLRPQTTPKSLWRTNSSIIADLGDFVTSDVCVVKSAHQAEAIPCGASPERMRCAMNPFLKKLGFSSTDRVAIVHADDIGAYQASLPAIEDLFEAGLVSSCATMVPCSWFPAVAE